MARVLTLLMVSLLGATATFAQTTAPTEESIREVMNRVHGYLLTAAPLRPINGDTGAAISLDNMPQNVALAKTTLPINTYDAAVTYNGMLRATGATGDQRYRNYVNANLTGLARMAANMRANYPNATFETYPSAVSGSVRLNRVLFPQNLDDSGAMCFAMIRALRGGVGTGTGSSALRPWIDNYADWVSKRQFRLSDGTFARNTPMPNTVWLDDIFMSVSCLAQMGTLTGDRSYYDDAAKQILRFYARMHVQATNLWRHGWVQEMDPHPTFHWGRANGWAMMAMAELLTELPLDHPNRPAVLTLFKQLATALKKYQAPSGLWHQLVDRPDSYEETSSSAMYTFAIARGIRYGWLSNTTFHSTVVRGWNGLTTTVNSTGQVEGICVGTSLGWDDTYYLNRPTSVNAGQGYGPIFLAGSDVILLLRAFP